MYPGARCTCGCLSGRCTRELVVRSWTLIYSSRSWTSWWKRKASCLSCLSPTQSMYVPTTICHWLSINILEASPLNSYFSWQSLLFYTLNVEINYQIFENVSCCSCIISMLMRPHHTVCTITLYPDVVAVGLQLSVRANLWLSEWTVLLPFRSGFTNSSQLADLLNANYLKPTIRVSPTKVNFCPTPVSSLSC